MSVTSINIAQQLKELQEDIIDLRASFLASCARNKELEGMNERLRSELDVTRHHHKNCEALLRQSGTIIKRGRGE